MSTSSQEAVAKGCALIIVWLIIVALIPSIAIWAVNTLFVLAIPYTLKNWFAMFLLIAIFAGSSKAGNSNS